MAAGDPFWHIALDQEIVGLAACTKSERLAVATRTPEIVLVSAGGEIRQRWTPEAGRDEVLSLTATAGGARLLVGWMSGLVMLLDSADLSVLGLAQRHRYELLGNITEAKGAGVVAQGGAAWLDTPWVLLHPTPRRADLPHPVDEQGVVQVRFNADEPHVGGWGWWDTRTDTVLWSLAGTLGMGEAPFLGLSGASLVSPALEGGMGVSIYALGLNAGDATGVPAVRLSMQHALPGFAAELLASADGRLLLARTSGELLLFAPDEPEPVARVPVPDSFRAITLTGDGALLVGRMDRQVVALSLDPDRWSQEVRCRAGRGLSDGERRTYLSEIGSLTGADRC
jgi:hypothetical protein